MKTSFKRITALALTASMAASLCACGGKSSTPKAEPGVANTNTDQTNFEIVGGISALSGGYDSNTVLNELQSNTGISIKWDCMSDSLSE